MVSVRVQLYAASVGTRTSWLFLMHLMVKVIPAKPQDWSFFLRWTAVSFFS